MQKLLRRRRQVQLLRSAGEGCPVRLDLLDGRLFSLKRDEAGCHVTIRAGHTQALRGNCGGGGVFDVVALDFAPELERLLLRLFFFAADIGDDVVDHFWPCFKRLACAGNCLIRADERLFHAVFHQRMQRGDIALQRAVGLDGDKAALRAEALSLCVDDPDVIGVDLRHDHRNVRRPAVRGVVGDDGALQLCILFFERLDFVFLHIDRAEDKVDHRGNFLCVRFRVHDNQLAFGFRNVLLHEPFARNGVLVCLACAVGAGSEHDRLEPRMLRRQQDEPLTDHARCANDTDFILLHTFSLHFYQSLGLIVPARYTIIFSGTWKSVCRCVHG